MWHHAAPSVSFAKYIQTSSAAWEILPFFSQTKTFVCFASARHKPEPKQWEETGSKPPGSISLPQTAASCLPSSGSLAFELSASWYPRGVLPSLTYTVVVRLCSSVICIVAGSQDRNSHFPSKGQQHLSSRGNLATGPQHQRTLTSHRDVTTAALMQANKLRRGMKPRAHPYQGWNWCLSLQLWSHCWDSDLSLLRIYDPRHPCLPQELHLSPGGGSILCPHRYSPAAVIKSVL